MRRHTTGLTQLFRDAADTIGARSTPGGGWCFHRGGSGRARSLWESQPGTPAGAPAGRPERRLAHPAPAR